MSSPLFRYRGYVLALCASLFFLVEKYWGPEQAALAGPLVLFVAALMLSGTRLRVKGLRGSLATSNTVLVGTVVALPPPLAIPAAVTSAALRFHLERKGRSGAMDYLWPALSAALSAAVALFAYGIAETALRLPWLSMSAACVTYLFVAGLTESALERRKYWKRMLLSQVSASGATALVFAPASVALALLFSAFRDPWLWAAVPLLVLAYSVFERFRGPLNEDLGKRAETDEVFLRAVEALALAVDAKDSVSSGHLKRVQRYCTEIAKALNCTGQEIRTLEFGSLLHDIGKIAVPENVLTKPGRLSPSEFSRVASHVQIGAEILSAVNFPLPVDELVLSHHENWNGTGYPRKLKGEQIPLTARILSVVDAFDALTSDRPYRPAVTVEHAVEQIRSRRGEAFDPRVADTLIELLPDLEKQIQRDPQASRQSSAGRFSIQSPRSVDAEQTSLTHEERIESLKQTREVAQREIGARDFSGWYRLLSTLSRSLSVQELLEFLVAPLTSRVPFDECAVLMVRNTTLTPVYCTGRKADLLRNLRIPIGSSPSGWVAGHGQALLNGNPIGEHSELGLMAWLIGLKAALVIPLWEHSRVVGTFNLYSKSAGAFSNGHADLTENLTRNLGGVLRQAFLFETSQPDPLDRLTGFPTARQTLKHLRSEVCLARDENRDSSVIYIDINDFRQINARFGVETGNQLLQACARTARATLRKLDYLGRLGDDQFLAVLGGIKPKNLAALAARLKAELKSKLTRVCGDEGADIKVSVGPASFPADAQTAEELVIVSHHRLHVGRIHPGAISPAVARKVIDQEKGEEVVAAEKAGQTAGS